MKKIIIWIILNLFFVNCFWFEDEVKANIKWWVYDSFLEIYLNNKNPEAKIFYYTDWIWRFDNLIEYKKWTPIIITKDTSLNFFSVLNEFESTKIKEETYFFQYKKDLEIFILNNFLYIKNYSKNILNLWFREIKWDNYQKIIKKNTFIKPNEELKIDKIQDKINNLKLISPDKKIIINEKIIKEPKKEIQTLENIKEQEIEELKKNNIEKFPTIKIYENNKSVTENNKKIINNIKTSVLDSNQKNKKKENNFYIFIVIFALFTFFMTLYNIFIVIKTWKKINKKIWKK